MVIWVKFTVFVSAKVGVSSAFEVEEWEKNRSPGTRGGQDVNSALQ
jgi:hypothetical protein